MCWVQTPPIRYFQWSCFICLRLIRGGQGVNWPFVLAYPRFQTRNRDVSLSLNINEFSLLQSPLPLTIWDKNSQRDRGKCDNTCCQSQWKSLTSKRPVKNENNLTRGRCLSTSPVLLWPSTDWTTSGEQMSSPPSYLLFPDFKVKLRF